MTKTDSRGWKRWGGDFFSPNYFFVRALALVILFVLAHLAGLREYTTFLSGTTEHTSISMDMSARYGIAYILLYLGCVVLAPILALAGGLLALWQSCFVCRAKNGVLA